VGNKRQPRRPRQRFHTLFYRDLQEPRRSRRLPSSR
jgi:hypothetical protein